MKNDEIILDLDESMADLIIGDTLATEYRLVTFVLFRSFNYNIRKIITKVFLKHSVTEIFL